MPELLDPMPATEVDHLVGGAARRIPPAGGGSARTAPGEVGRRAARVELRRQIARMEAELVFLFGSSFPRKGIEWTVGAVGGPRVLDIGELERVRDALAARLGEVRGDLHSRANVEERKRELLEHVIAEPERYHWVRISNEDIGEPGCRHWHSRPRWGLLGVLMNWWRVKVSSGCPLATGARLAASRPNSQA
jgi:hypothetical protein